MAKSSHPASGIIAQFGKHVLPWVGDDPARADAVRRALQDLVAGKHPVATTTSVPPALRAQVAKVQEFLHQYGSEPGFRPEDIPAAPASDGQLLLAVYLPDRGDEPGWLRTLHDWWQFDCSQRRNNWLWSGFQFDTSHLRLAPGINYEPGIRWVEYEPNAYAGKSPKQALKLAQAEGAELAGAEAIMAAVLLDGYVGSWFSGGNVAPNLTAYQFDWDGDGAAWSFSPFLFRGGAGLELHANSADDAYRYWGSPRLRRVQN